MPTVWIGAAGTATAYGLIRSLRRAWPDTVRIIAADTNPPTLVASAALADETVVVPPLVDLEFEPALIKGLGEVGADTYVPLLDAEILLAAELREAARYADPLRHVKAPSVESSRLCFDKLEMARFLLEHGLPTPQTWGHDEAPRDGRALMIKPRRGFGSVGVEPLSDGRPIGADELVQETCAPPEVTVDAFRSRHGLGSACVCRERLEVKAGVATKVRVFEDDALGDLARRLGDVLDLGGAFCFQTMRRGGDWAITDVNARSGGGTAMSVAVGFDVLAADMADLWGEDPSRFLSPVPRPRTVVRAYTELVMD